MGLVRYLDNSGGGVNVLNASHGQELLGDKGGNNPGTTRGGYQTATHGTALGDGAAANEPGFPPKPDSLLVDRPALRP